MGRQHLPSLLRGLTAAFPDSRKGRAGDIAVADFGLSPFSLFFMQSGSFLSCQREMQDQGRRSNCQLLFGISHIPSDASIRSHLDLASPRLLEPCFELLESAMAEPALAEAFSRLGGRTPIALDGTECFCSGRIGCPQCLSRRRANGETEYCHVMLAASIVAPGHSRVIPLMPEFVANHDGAAKQDCERNAAKRWHGRHGKRLKALRPVCLGEDAREASHKVLCEFISGALLQRHAGVERKGKTRKTLNYRWIEDVPLRDGEDAITVTWIGFDIADDKGRSLCSTALVTSLAVTAETVADIVQAATTADGRSKTARSMS